MRRCRVCETEKPLDRFARHHGDVRKRVCKTCDNARKAKWEKENSSHVKAQAKAWRERNHDHVLAYWADWRNRNRTRMAAYSRKSHQKHMKAVVARVARYLKAHPEKRRQFKLTRRALENGATGSVTAEQLVDLFASYLGLCVYCSRVAAEVDHLVPLSAGGSNDITNLVPACRRCNRSKNDKPLLIFLAARRLAA